MAITERELSAIFDPLMLATIAAQPFEYRNQRATTLSYMGIDRVAVKNICNLNEQQMRRVEIATAEIIHVMGPFE